MKNSQTVILLLVILTVLGCVETSGKEPTGKGNIRGLNASVSAPSIAFQIGERLLELTEYKQASAAVAFDDLEYILNFDYLFAADTGPTRLVTTTFQLVKDTDYLFIFTGSINAPGSIAWERPLRAWDGTETVMLVRFGHLSPQLGEVDVYLTNPGEVPVLGEARATLTNGNRSDAVELPAGNYTFFVTGKDDPANILFASSAVNYQSSEDFLLAIFDADPSIVSPVSVRVITDNGVSGELTNTLTPPTLRVIHTALGTAAIDLYRDNDFSAPLIANVANRQVSVTVTSVSDISTYTFTPAGSIAAVLHEEDFGVGDGLHTSRFLLGPAGALETLPVIDNFRSVDDAVKLRLIQTSNNQQFVDIYIVEHGVGIADFPPRFPNMFFKGNSGYITLRDNTYEMYATLPGVKDVVAGPLAFSVVAGDVLHFMLVDTVDPNVLQLIKYEHFSATSSVPGPVP